MGKANAPSLSLMAWHQPRHVFYKDNSNRVLIGLPWGQAENEALQALVVDVAANKAEARKRVAALKEKYSELLAKVGAAVPFRADAGHSACSSTGLALLPPQTVGVSHLHAF